jgi:SAM-dependent methyltransferase
MFDFHSNSKRYFEMQYENCRDYVIPFIEQTYKLREGCRVLEIGCAEGGVLKAFLERGCYGVGVELSAGRAERAKELLSAYADRLELMARDIYDVNPATEFGGKKFDLIVLKDVIEHIHDQPRLVAWMRTFLNPDGAIFFGFPPWQMPFGGHQQMCRNKLLSKLPYFHLLPTPLYRWVLKCGMRGSSSWRGLVEIKETGISIEKFEKVVRRAGLAVSGRLLYLLNPIYRYKFGWKPRKQLRLVAHIPYLRDFVTTCAFYMVQHQPQAMPSSGSEVPK